MTLQDLDLTPDLHRSQGTRQTTPTTRSSARPASTLNLALGSTVAPSSPPFSENGSTEDGGAIELQKLMAATDKAELAKLKKEALKQLRAEKKDLAAAQKQAKEQQKLKEQADKAQKAVLEAQQRMQETTEEVP